MTDTSHATSASVPNGPRDAAAWLVERHPQLRRLLERIPGFLDADGEPDVDLLAETLRAHDENVHAWTVYARSRPAPVDDDALEVWRHHGPAPSGHVDAVGMMSPSERARLRLLATFSPLRVPVSTTDFATLDGHGQQLLSDWATAVCAA